MKYLLSLGYSESSINSLYRDEDGKVLNYANYCWECGRNFASDWRKRNGVKECSSWKCLRLQRRLSDDRTPRQRLTRVYLVQARRSGVNQIESCFSLIKIGVANSIEDRVAQFRIPEWQYSLMSVILCPNRVEAFRIENYLHGLPFLRQRKVFPDSEIPSRNGKSEWFYLPYKEVQEELIGKYRDIQEKLNLRSYKELYYPPASEVNYQFLAIRSV